MMVLRRHRVRRRNDCVFLRGKNGSTQLRIEIGLAIRELFLQTAIRKFDRHELMMIARLAPGPERFVRDGVVTGAARNVIGAIAHRAAAADVQAKLQTARPKTASPIERTFRPEIMPL